MIDQIYDRENYILAKKLLDVSHARHEALSGNLANAETPGYKRVGKTPAESLFQASIGSIVVGILSRWVTSIWIWNVKQMLIEKRQTAVVAMVEAEESKRQEAKEQSAKPV